MLQYLVLARVGAFLAMYVFVQLSGGGVGERTYVAYNSSV